MAAAWGQQQQSGVDSGRECLKASPAWTLPMAPTTSRSEGRGGWGGQRRSVVLMDSAALLPLRPIACTGYGASAPEGTGLRRLRARPRAGSVGQGHHLGGRPSRYPTHSTHHHPFHPFTYPSHVHACPLSALPSLPAPWLCALSFGWQEKKTQFLVREAILESFLPEGGDALARDEL